MDFYFIYLFIYFILFFYFFFFLEGGGGGGVVGCGECVVYLTLPVRPTDIGL